MYHAFTLHTDLTCEEMFVLLGEALFDYYKWRGGEIRKAASSRSFEFVLQFELANRDDQHIANSFGGVNSAPDALQRLLFVLNSDSAARAQFVRTHRNAVSIGLSDLTHQQEVRVNPELLEFSHAPAPPSPSRPPRPPSPSRGSQPSVLAYARASESAPRTTEPQPRSSSAERVRFAVTTRVNQQQQQDLFAVPKPPNEQLSSSAATPSPNPWIYNPSAARAPGTSVRANPKPVASAAVPSVIVIDDNDDLLDDPTEGFGPSVSQIGAPVWRPPGAPAPRHVTFTPGAAAGAAASSTQPHLWTTFLTRGRVGAVPAAPAVRNQPQRPTVMYSSGWADDVPAAAAPATTATPYSVNRLLRNPTLIQPTDDGTSGRRRQQAAHAEFEVMDQMSGWRTPGRSEREATRVYTWFDRELELPDAYDLRRNRSAISCCNFAPDSRRF